MRGSAEFRGTTRFELRRRLGAGGMGVVYEAFDRDTSEPVALKTLHEMDPQALYRLKNEFRALQDIEHPNLVGLRDLVNEDGQWFFTMELVDGTDFLTWVCGDTVEVHQPPTDETAMTARQDTKPTFPFNERRLRDGLRQLAAGLFALHDAGKIHRDIKPGNIMVNRQGDVVLLDFGLVTASSEEDARNSTTEGVVVGTVGYMAPEQAAAKSIGPPADWYAVGVLLYEALTGRLPFTGSVIEVLMNKQVMEPARPSTLVAGIPEDLDALCHDLLQTDPDARPIAKALRRRLGVSRRRPPSTSRITQSSPFVGRVGELAELRSAFVETRGGAVAVRVHGDSGMGKSALLKHFSDGLTRVSNALVFTGRCREREAVPYKALDEVVDSLSRYLRKLPKAEAATFVPPNAALLPRLFPVLGRVEVIAQAPLPRQPLKDPHVLRSRAFHALRGLLYSLAEHHPLVLVIDDIQWADADSLDALDNLLAPPDAPPLLLLCSSRPTARDDDAPDLPDSLDVREIELGPLDAEDASELARRLVEAADGGFIDGVELASEAHGHPLYIAELVRYTTTGGDRTQRPRLEDAIWERAQQLPAGAIDLLITVCLTSAPLPPETLRDAVELEASEFSKVLSVLRVANFVRTTEHAGRAVIDAYHDRVRRSVMGHTTDDLRRRWHGRIGVALESASEEVARPELLLSHMRAAGERGKATRYALEAARHAEAALAFGRAAELYQAAVELGAGGVKGGLVEAALGSALGNAGRGTEAAEAFLVAAELASGTQALELRRQAAEHQLRSGQFDRGLEMLRSVLEAVGLGYPESPLRALSTMLLRRAQLRVRGLGFQRRTPDQISAAEAMVVDVCWSAATGLSHIDPIRASVFSTRHLLLALRLGDPQRIARGLLIEIAFVSSGGATTRPRTQKLLAIGVSMLEGVEDPDLNALHLAAEAFANFQQGFFIESRESFERALEIFRDSCTGVAWEIGQMEHFSLAALTFMGEFARIAEVGPHHLRDAEERGDLQVSTNVRALLSPVVHLAQDRPEAARREARIVLDTWSQSGFHHQHYMALAALVQSDLYEGRGAEAMRQCAEHEKVVKKSLLLHAQIIRGHWRAIRGLSALAAFVEGDDRPALLRQASREARRLAREGAPWCTANATLIQAGIAAARGDHEGAAMLYESAIEKSENVHFGLQAAAARRRLGQLRGGEEGARLIVESTAWLRKHGAVVNLEATARVFAPMDRDRRG